jgi:hypothetical protein
MTVVQCLGDRRFAYKAKSGEDVAHGLLSSCSLPKRSGYWKMASGLSRVSKPAKLTFGNQRIYCRRFQIAKRRNRCVKFDHQGGGEEGGIGPGDFGPARRHEAT